MKSESIARSGLGWGGSVVSIMSMAVVGLLSACASMKGQDAGQSAAVPKPPSLAASAPAATADSRPVQVKKPSAADVALADGLKAYQAGQYKMAETQLKTALQSGLSAPADVANANKHLAFVFCTSKREVQCLAAFKAAKAAQPGFALSKTEAGHPMWAKTYKKALRLK
jgi:hypothetical protein